MENTMSNFDWTGIIGLLIIAGIFGFGGFGGYGNNAQNQITNDFLYTNLSNQVRDNSQAIATTDRDVLENRYQNSLQTQTLSSQLSECCCENRLAIANQTNALTATMNANTQAILDKMCQSEIQNLRDQVRGYELVSALGNQTNTISSRFGSWYLNAPYAPYYNGYTYGTTIM